MPSWWCLQVCPALSRHTVSTLICWDHQSEFQFWSWYLFQPKMHLRLRRCGRNDLLPSNPYLSDESAIQIWSYWLLYYRVDHRIASALIIWSRNRQSHTFGGSNLERDARLERLSLRNHDLHNFIKSPFKIYIWLGYFKRDRSSIILFGSARMDGRILLKEWKSLGLCFRRCLAWLCTLLLAVAFRLRLRFRGWLSWLEGSLFGLLRFQANSWVFPRAFKANKDQSCH